MEFSPVVSGGEDVARCPFTVLSGFAEPASLSGLGDSTSLLSWLPRGPEVQVCEGSAGLHGEEVVAEAWAARSR